MINQKFIFNKGINADDSFRLLSEGEYLNAENVRIGVSEFSKNFEVTNIPSTQLLFDDLPAFTLPPNTVGTAVDYSRLRLIWFVYNDLDEHGIYAYDVTLKTTYIVLISSQTAAGLNFSKSFRIDRNARVEGNLLLWTDNNNEPQCINIEAGIKLNQPSYVTDVAAYATPIPYETLTLIKRPPIFQLQASKFEDAGFDNNFIALNAYQFTCRYIYKDYQYSVLSTYSVLIPYNSPTDTFNAIDLRMPFGEIIPDYVQQVDFCVRYGNYGKTFVIKSYNKDSYYDRLAIDNHNDNTTQLGFSFYDNINGIAIDDTTANTAFDDIALRAKTLELARNRVFPGNVLKGYDTPATSSLSLTVGTFNTGGAGTYTAQWKYVNCYYFTLDPYNPVAPYRFYYAYVPSLFTKCYFYYAYQDPDSDLSPPPSVNAADADLTDDASEVSLAYHIMSIVPPFTPFHWDYNMTPEPVDTGYTLDLIVGSNVGNVQFLKSGSTYRASISFFDRFRRKCGVINKGVEATISERTADQTLFSAILNWALDNAFASTEIPDWAFYYQIEITKNLTTRFFAQIFANGTDYVLKAQDGTYSYSHSTYSLNSTYAIGFDLTALTNKGIGYTFNEGDYVRMFKTDGTNILLRVIGQDGNFILCSPEDIGTLGSSTGFLIEIYTPYKASVTEPFFETGDMYRVLNPTENNRAYSVTNGSINGDCYAVERDKGSSDFYFCEAMSPNDKIWQIWQTDRGWASFIDTIGQQLKETNIDWSDTYINGTKTNGLNKFQPLNTKDIGNSSGAIQKLQLTNKMEESGDVMLVVASEQVLSAYLGEVQIYKAAQSDGLITTDDVIGTINPLKFTCGTINPESVIEWNGTVWGVDVIRGLVWQYDTNGIVPVSYFKTRSFWDRFGKRYVEQGATAIEALCGFSYITACVDPSSGEVMFVLPQTEENTVTSGIPVGFAPALPSYSTLPDYASSIQDRFYLYDGQPKIMVYKYEQNTWSNAYQWLPDCMEYVGNKLFGFKEGKLYLFNENTSSYNTIFGVQYPQRLCFAVGGIAVKDLGDIALEIQNIPNYSVAYITYPDEQITDLTEDDYATKEGVQYAEWFKDRLSPNVGGTVITKMMEGDNLKSAIILIMLEFSEYGSQLIINFVDIGFLVSGGHLQILQNPKS